MRFAIYRASDGYSPKQPTEAAYLAPHPTRGNAWYIDINSLEELIALAEKEEQELIISKNEIVIYDGYME